MTKAHATTEHHFASVEDPAFLALLAAIKPSELRLKRRSSEDYRLLLGDMEVTFSTQSTEPWTLSEGTEVVRRLRARMVVRQDVAIEPNPFTPVAENSNEPTQE